jgi:predicted nucleotidyltransferase
MKRRETIRRRLKDALEPRQEIIFGYLHGSFQDEALPYNDVDVAIYVKPVWALGQDLFEYGMSLSADLSLDLGVSVDVQVLNDTPLGFQHTVLREGEVFLNRDDEVLTDFIEQVGFAYMEFAYYVREYLRDVMS